jgi:hypothetical protein
MTPDFNATDSDTWPLILTPEQIAAIYQRPVGGIKKAVQQHRFHPAPKLGPSGYERPLRWRKVDVLRDIQTGRTAGITRFKAAS